MKKSRRRPESIVNDKINPGLVSTIRTRSLFDGEITGIIKHHLKNPDKYELAKSLLQRVKVFLDRGCWIISEDWSVYSTHKKQIGHRLSYELFVGEIEDGKLICHKCDRKGCISFIHLFQGTDSDNIQDYKTKHKKYLHGRKFGEASEILPWNKIEPVKVNPLKSRLDNLRNETIIAKAVANSKIPLAERLARVTGRLK